MRRVTTRGLRARKLRLGLTALAIVLGVTFVTGTLVLSDTLNRTFDNLVGTAYGKISFEIRGKAAFGNTAAGASRTADRRPVPAPLVAEVRRLPGVAYLYGSVSGYAQFVDHSGNAIGSGAGKTLGFSFDPYSQLSSYRLVAGRAPTSPADVVMDKATATKYHFALGDPVRVLLPSGTRTFTVSGIVTFGSDDNLIGITLAGFDQATAQSLFNLQGYYNTIEVRASSGADSGALQQEIAQILPAGVEVVSGQTVVSELSTAISNALSFISTALLIFALISLVVGGFTIFNTFTITVGQRTRELALLRVVGASRRQVFGSVLAEAALTGLVASLIGLGLGVTAALGLEALLKAFGVVLPSAPLVFKARTPVVAIAVGVLVTLLSALLPACRAVRIPPVAALADPSGEQRRPLRGSRATAGIGVCLVGVVAVIAGMGGPSITLVGIGALAVFLAAGLLLPVLAGPLASALGRPLAALLGAPGRIGRENATRNPLRTAQTAAALMIGLTLVSTIAVLGSSLSTSAEHNVDSALSADYIVTGSGGFSNSVPGIVSRLPGARTTTTVYKGRFEFRGSLSTIAAATPADLDRTVNLHVTAGQGAAAMAAGELLVDTNTANADHLHVGSVVAVKFAQTGSTTMQIGGIYAYNPLVGSFVTGTTFFLSHFENPLPSGVLVQTVLGTQNFETTLNAALVSYPNLNIQSRAQFESSQQASINQLLGLIYVLLALAVVIALIGIVNTLLLSVFERTREIGLLRAVGMKRRQVRDMIRSESVIVALFGAVTGIAIGTGLGLAVASSLRENGVTNISVPIPTLIGFLVLSILLGLAAARWPGSRAANLDVLAAIATE
jgi:putative ABC transport system permease protein